MINARSVVHILDIIVGETGVGQVVTHTQSGGQNYYTTSIFTCKKMDLSQLFLSFAVVCQ